MGRLRRRDTHKRQRRNAPGPSVDQLAERFRIEGDPEDALRVLLGVPLDEAEEEAETQ